MATPLLSSETLARFAMTARLGAAVSRPFRLLDGGAGGLEPLGLEKLAALAAFPPFRRPIERALGDARGIGPSFALPRQAVDAACDTPEGRLAILLVAEPLAAVTRAALQCAAVAMQRQILGAMRKDERQRIRMLIGAENFSVATQEAPTLHPGLAALGSDLYFRETLAGTDETARERFTSYGLKLLLEFVEATQAPLVALFAARLPTGIDGVATGAPLAPHAKSLLKFIRRRMPEWSAIIG